MEITPAARRLTGRKPKTDRSQVVNLGTKAMKESKIDRTVRLMARLGELGFDYAEVKALLRIERTLQRWGEAECGDGNDYASWAIERDETSGKPFMVTYPHNGPTRRQPIPDREAAAKARLEKLMAKHPNLVSYHQGDCRGCNLYILERSQVGENDIGTIYNRGVAVCAD